MAAFLDSVAGYIYERYKDRVENLCIVLPNKRSALFLKKSLGKAFGTTIWLPQIISAEEFIAELSGLKTLEEIDLVCHLYNSYRTCYGAEAESFDSFARWGQLILQDFNEIDRYLAPPEQLYENLKDIKVIENWSLGQEALTDHQQAYLRFMNSLGAIYKHYTGFLLSRGWAYQGLAYRRASQQFHKSDYPGKFHKMIFCGFNALNAAELKIFKGLDQQKKADFLWDADKYYLDNNIQEAGMFMRDNFEFLGQKDPLFIGDNFSGVKNIRILSVPRQVGQAQVVKQTIQSFIDREVPLGSVAVVLANEKLLGPVLQQLPAGVQHVNITMEYPVRHTATYNLMDQLVQLQVAFAKQTRAQKTVYHKDLTGLLRQPLCRIYLRAIAPGIKPSAIISQVVSRNLSFVSPVNLAQLFGDDFAAVRQLLSPEVSMSRFCDVLLGVVQTCIEHFAGKSPDTQLRLELEYLHIFLKNFNRLAEVLAQYPQFNDIQAFRQLFSQIIGNASAPFIGEPLQGLQIMGVLETRALDFEHLILVNVNEGVLPSGKSSNSFIPNDLKRAFGLPLYQEKDAVYAYHFYRLLQNARDVVITYDSETDSLGKGEKSRFVTQLQLEMQIYNPGIQISEEVATYDQLPPLLDNIITIHKNDQVLAPILSKATSADKYGGLSPSGLTAMKECPLKFYFRYGAHLKEAEAVEESAEANTFGSILHLSLETLYKPFAGKIISAEALKAQLKQIDATVDACFLTFSDNHAPAGKSLLQREVIKVYVRKLLDHDLRFIESLTDEDQLLTLNYLEHELSSPLDVEINGTKKTLFIKGKIDRVDAYNGWVRVIDYKSSVKDSDKFTFDGFDQLFNDTDYNKQFQLVVYAWLIHKNKICPPEKIVPCIIPFKKFSDQPRQLLTADKQPLRLTADFLDAFEDELRVFVGRIFDQEIPFSQTDDDQIHEYCPYNTICNFKV